MAEISFTVQEVLDAGLRRIRAETGASSPLFAVALEELNKTINTIVMANINWRWLKKTTTIVTVKAAKQITLPVNCLAVNSVWYLSGGRIYDLDLVSEDFARQEYPNDADTGQPSDYISGVYDTSSATVPPVQTLILKPTPDAVYTLNVSYQSSIKKYTSSDGTEVIPLPQYVQSALEELFQARMLKINKNSRTEIDSARADGLSFLQAAKAFDRLKNNARRAIRPRPAIRSWRARRYTQ